MKLYFMINRGKPNTKKKMYKLGFTTHGGLYDNDKYYPHNIPSITWKKKIYKTKKFLFFKKDVEIGVITILTTNHKGKYHRYSDGYDHNINLVRCKIYDTIDVEKFTDEYQKLVDEMIGLKLLTMVEHDKNVPHLHRAVVLNGIVDGSDIILSECISFDNGKVL